MAEVETKKKSTRAQQPDKAEQEDTLKIVQSQISKHMDDMKVINQKIREKSTGKEEFQQRKAVMKAKLDEYQAYIKQYENDKQAHYDAIKETNNASRQLSSEMKNVQATRIPGLDANIRNAEDAKKHMADIDRKMQTTTMSLKQEKLYMEILKELKKQIPKLTQASAMSDSVEAGKSSVVQPHRDEVNKLNTLISEAREAKKQQMQQYQKLIEQRSTVMKDMPALFDQRDQCNKKLGNAHMQKKALIEDFRSKEKQYYAQQAEMRQVKFDKQRADRLERQADNESRRLVGAEAAEEEQPYLYETTLLEQTICYCESLIKKPETKEVVAQTINHSGIIPEGAQIIKSKEDREDEFFFAPKGKSKNKSKAKGQVKTDGPKGPSADDKIKHNVETLTVFGKVGVKPPIVIGDVEPIIKELKKKLDSYSDKVKKWNEDKEKRAAEQAKTLAEAQVKLEALRAQAKEAREQARQKDAEAKEKMGDEEDDAEKADEE